jgi:ATP-binding protein involved in chromosome partitioning
MTDPVAAVRAALATVQDPDLHRDLVALNMIRELRIADGVASFSLVLTTGACPVKKQLEDQCRVAALSVPGITRADILVTAEVPQGADGKNTLPGVRKVIAVGSGKGGVGKSTVAVNLAVSLAQAGARVGLLDADIYGPSVPTMMGIHRQPLVVDKKLVPVEAHGIKLISIGFLVEQRQAMVWRGPMVVGALKQFLTDVAWGELDYLLIDLPPGTGDVQLTLAQNAPLAGAVVVSTPQAVALADVRRSVSMFEKVGVTVFGIVENMSEFVCPRCGHVEPIFGVGGAEREAGVMGLPFLGRVPLEPGVREAGDAGTPIVAARPDSASARAFRSIAERVAQRVSISALTSSAATGTPAP